MRNSIRKRLTLAFIGLAIGPLLLVGIILAWQSFTTQEHQALNLQREMAQRVSTEMKAFSDELESELRLVNQVQGLQKLDRNSQRDVLGELLAYQASFESLDLLDSQGQEQVRLARSSVMPAEKLGNRAKADEFVIPQTTGRTYYSPVRFDETTGEPFMTIAVPLHDVRTGLVDGVLVSEVRLKRIWDMIMDLQTSPGQSVYIVDAQNKVIAHRNPSVVLVGTTFQIPDQDGTHPGLTGSSVVLVVDKVGLGGQTFYVVAEQTVTEALALAINTILITATLLVGALAMSVVLGLVIVRQIVHPIQAMATTAQAISAGDLSRQVQVTSRDEVGVLAAAFNSMTAQLRRSLESLEQQVVEVKQAEESLRRANETLQALIDHSPLAIMMLDLANHVLLWNSAAEKMYGWTAQEVLGEFSPYLPEDKREEQQVIRERVTQGEISTNLELERRRKDGSKIFIGASFAPLRDSTGSIYAFMSIAADITERKKAEQALWESEERLQQIALSLREVIWLRDVQTRQVLYVNPAFEELTGRSCESLYENRDIMMDSIHPDDREQVIKALDQRERVPYDKEHRILRLDGSVRWVSSRSVPVRNEAGEVYRWASIMEDITAHKQAEEEIQRLNAELEQRVADRTAELARAHEHLRAILDTAGEGVVFTDLQGTIEYINPAMERLTGHTTEEALGRNPRLWKSDQTPLTAHQRMWGALTRGEIWEGELINRRKDGTLYDAALTAAPLTNPEGQIVGFVGVQRDITRQKELERMKDQFVSNVSHELRTPLANILLHIGLLEHGKPDRLASYQQTLRREAERLRKLIEDLLDLSRLDRDVVPIQFMPTDLNQLLAQLVTDRATLTEQRGLTLTYEPAPDLPLILTDASKIIQVASNLLTNALNYTPAGGVVSVWAEERHHEGQKLAAFTVRDTGPGITAQDLPHLFERFYRGAAGRQARAPGTGLGLAISQEIMKRLGGRITLESEAGRGAAFTVWLPIASAVFTDH